MRCKLSATVAVIIIAASGSAFAQSSARASNASSADTRSEIAPQLPAPAVAADAGPRAFLMDARAALNAGRTGEAQEALERAESRALDRASDPVSAARTDNAPVIRGIASARDALGRGDLAAARQTIADALALPHGSAAPARSASTGTTPGLVGAGSAGAPSQPMPVMATAPAQPNPMVSSAGETAMGCHQVYMHPGDDSRTYNTPGNNDFTESCP